MIRLIRVSISVAAVADMALGEQIVLAQLNLGAIGHGHVALTPEVRQLETGILSDDVSQRGLKLGGVDMLSVDPPHRVSVDALRSMMGRLAGAQVAAVHNQCLNLIEDIPSQISSTVPFPGDTSLYQHLPESFSPEDSKPLLELTGWCKYTVILLQLRNIIVRFWI
jgi:hypothetical protein